VAASSSRSEKSSRPTVATDADQVAREDRRHLVHGFASPAVTDAEGTITLVRGRGVWVWDIHGRRYLDGLASLWNVHVGHGRAEIARAVAAQTREIAFVPTLLGFSSPPAVRLAARLADLAPPGLTRVVFTSGGSEANESLIRLVRLYWRLRGRNEKHQIVALERAYHGSSMGAASLTGLPYFHQYFEPMMPGVLRMPNAYCYRCPLHLSYPGCGIACADELERVVEREGADRIAAFIAEPIQGVGGVIVPPPGYFERIREICDRHEILMVVDEVITGFGRTGTAFGIGRWQAIPDLIVFAKGVTSGYQPLGGVLIHERVYQTLLDAGPGFSLHHGFTYSGHPVACAAGLANLDIMEREGLFDAGREKAAYFAQRLEPLRRLPLVGDLRTAGLLAAVELVADKERRTPFPAEVRASFRVREAAVRRGVIVRGSGDNVVVCPPLIIKKAQINLLVRTLREAILEVGAELGGA
jgi:adenosylmethionine-8-amino-7-oxononanoate aminotransferase